MELEKVYIVEFIEYTNCMRDTVYNEETGKFLHVGRLGFLVPEFELEKYRKYGKGYESIKLVGQICVESEE